MGKYAPVPVVGDVTVLPPFFPEERTWRAVGGWRFDEAWVDLPSVGCEMLGG